MELIWEQERGRCGCAGPCLGQSNQGKLPKTPWESAPGREEQCRAGLRLNGCKFTVNKLGLCLRSTWNSFPQLVKHGKILGALAEAVAQGKCELPQCVPISGGDTSPRVWSHLDLQVQSPQLPLRYRSRAGLGKEIAKGE